MDKLIAKYGKLAVGLALAGGFIVLCILLAHGVDVPSEVNQ